MNKMLSFQLLAVISFVSGSYALYESAPDVIKLSPSNFTESVTNSSSVWVVMFYAPWCRICQMSVPEYTKAACALKGIAKLGAIDAVEYNDFGQFYGLTGYPMIRVFTGVKNVPYKRRRDAESYIEAVLDAAKKKATASLNNGACKLPDDQPESSSSESDESGENSEEYTISSKSRYNVNKYL